MKKFSSNKGKKLTIKIDGQSFARFPIRTCKVMPKDNLFQIIQKFVLSQVKHGDFLFISERVVAITQDRAYPIAKIKPSKLANFLQKFVSKNPGGIGLASPWTMELALREVGSVRILFAAFVSAITKPFGARGLFYRIAGRQAAAIDGPCSYTLPPYNKYATLGPKNPNEVAAKIEKKFKIPTVIIDANDLGVDVLGVSSSKISKKWAEKVFADNPLGQSDQQTPMALVRKARLQRYA